MTKQTKLIILVLSAYKSDISVSVYLTLKVFWKNYMLITIDLKNIGKYVDMFCTVILNLAKF